MALAKNRNSTCKLFLKKIGKKIIFAIRRKKAFFLDFYSQALLKCRTRTSFSPRITTSISLRTAADSRIEQNR